MSLRDSAGARMANGMVLLGVLLLLALMTLVAWVGAEVWSTAVKREREAELLFIGDQYRSAIESYWRATPGPHKMLPHKLSDLLLDRRFPMPVRHLRRAYRDPMDPAADWGVVRGPDGIAGVYSNSEAAPLKRGGFPERYVQFEHASAYKHWRFVAQGQAVAPAPRRPSDKAGGLPES